MRNNPPLHEDIT